jgi:hypothetical protein
VSKRHRKKHRKPGARIRGRHGETVEASPPKGVPGSGFRLTRRGTKYAVRESPLLMAGQCEACGYEFVECSCTGIVMDFAPVRGWLKNGGSSDKRAGWPVFVDAELPKGGPATPVTILAGHYEVEVIDA